MSGDRRSKPDRVADINRVRARSAFARSGYGGTTFAYIHARRLVEAAGVVPRAATEGRRSKPDYVADIDRAVAREVEAAGVEPASESTSS